MLTGDNGTLTIQDIKLASLAYKTLCDVWVHVSKFGSGTCILGKELLGLHNIHPKRWSHVQNCINFATRQLVRRYDNGSNVEYFNTKSTSVTQHSCRRRKKGDKRFCSGCSHGNRVNSPKSRL